MTDHLKTVCDNWDVDDAGYTQLAALTRDCLFVIHSLEADEDIPVGASKYGGNPDVATPFDWPHSQDGPLWFMCQINLAELPAQLGGLPSSGLLSFFFDEAQGRAGGGSIVSYQHQTNELSRISEHDGNGVYHVTLPYAILADKTSRSKVDTQPFLVTEHRVTLLPDTKTKK